MSRAPLRFSLNSSLLTWLRQNYNRKNNRNSKQKTAVRCKYMEKDLLTCTLRLKKNAHICLMLPFSLSSNFPLQMLVISVNSAQCVVFLPSYLNMIYCQPQARLKPKRCLGGFIFTLNNK